MTETVFLVTVMPPVRRTRWEKIVKTLSMLYETDYVTKRDLMCIVQTNYNKIKILFAHMEKMGLIEIVPQRTAKASYRITKKGTETFRHILEVYRNLGMEIK